MDPGGAPANPVVPALPVQFWGLDPVFWAHVKLFVGDARKLMRYPHTAGAFRAHSHPLSRVEIVGCVVELVSKATREIFVVDDGTGVIMCCRPVSAGGGAAGGPSLGDLVRVRGSMGEFRGNREIHITDLSRVRDPNAEMLHWVQAVKLDRSVYSKPSAIHSEVKVNAMVAGAAARACARVCK